MGIPKKEQFVFLQALYSILDIGSGKLISLYKVAFDEKALFIAYIAVLKKKRFFLGVERNEQARSKIVCFKNL